MDFVRNSMAVLRREWKSYFESPVAYVFLAFYLVLIGVFTFILNGFYEMGQANLRPFFFWHPWVYLLLVPAVSMRLWSEERRSGTIELLLTLPVTMTQAVLGKFIAAWLFLGLALALTCPIVLTTVFWLSGDVDGGAIIGGYVGSFLLAGTYLAVGMATSAMTRNQVISFVVSVGMCLVLAMIGFPPFTSMMVKWAPGWAIEVVAAFSVMPHYDTLQRGVLDLRDIGYFVSVIVAMLVGTRLILENKR